MQRKNYFFYQINSHQDPVAPKNTQVVQPFAVKTYSFQGNLRDAHEVRQLQTVLDRAALEEGTHHVIIYVEIRDIQPKIGN